MTASRRRRTYALLAQELHDLSERPENLGRTWTWPTIGVMLGVNATTAQHLVQWMRKNYTEIYWTVGTYKSDYKTSATRQVREALDGMLNQQRHLLTRLQTMVQGWTTLARIDPDQVWRGFAKQNADHFASRIKDETDFAELLQYRAERLGWNHDEAIPEGVPSA